MQDLSHSEKNELFRQFLIHGSQRNHSETTDLLLDHPALALLMKHKIKQAYNKQNCFLLGGSEDLRVLLKFLDLSKEGAEAYIWLRPYIHSIGLYLFRIHGKLQAYLFEPQAWGERYYPNRLIISALANQYPDIKIRELFVELQSKEDQISCHAHVFNFFDSLAKLGSQVLAQNDNENTNLTVHHYPIGYDQKFAVQRLQAPLTSSAKKLHETDIRKIIELRFRLRDDYLRDEIFPEYLSKEKTIDWDKIWQVIEEMQGKHICKYESLTPEDALIFDAHLEVNGKQCELVFSFLSKDYLKYGNFLIYKNALYPKDDVKEESIFGPEITQKIEQDKEGRYVLRVIAPDFTVLLKTCQEMRLSLRNYFFKQMRQTLALDMLSAEFQQLMCLKDLQKNGNGLWVNQAWGALYYLLKDQPHTQVTFGYYNQKDQDNLIISQINASNKRSIFIPYAISSDHAILLYVDNLKKTIQIYDSKSFACSLQSIPCIKMLQDLDKNYSVKFEKPHYFLQEDDYSCILYVIQQSLNIAKQTTPVKPEKLQVEKIILPFYRAYLLGSKELEEVGEDFEKNVSQKRFLLEAVESIRFERKHFQDPVSNDILKLLADKLQIELWGNLDRRETPFDNPKRQIEQSHVIRGRSLLEFLDETISASQGSFTAYLLQQIKKSAFYLRGLMDDDLVWLIHQLLDEEVIDGNIRAKVIAPLIEMEVSQIQSLNDADLFTEENFINYIQSYSNEHRLNDQMTIIKKMFTRYKKQHLLSLQESNVPSLPTLENNSQLSMRGFFNTQTQIINQRIPLIKLVYPHLDEQTYVFLAWEGYTLYVALKALHVDDARLRKFPIKDLIEIQNVLNNETGNDDEDDEDGNGNLRVYDFLVSVFFDIKSYPDGFSIDHGRWRDLSDLWAVIHLIFKHLTFFDRQPSFFLTLACLREVEERSKQEDDEENERGKYLALIAVVSLKIIKENITTRDVISTAVAYDIVALAEFILDHDPSITDTMMLLMAAELGATQILLLLLEKYPGLDCNVVGKEKLNALDYCVKKGSNAIDALLQHGAHLSGNIEANNEIYSSLQNNSNFLEAAVLAGFDCVNFKSSTGETLLEFYVRTGQREGVKFLVEQLSAHTVTCSGGISYTELALLNHKPYIASFLYENKVDFDLSNQKVVDAILTIRWFEFQDALNALKINITRLQTCNHSNVFHLAVFWGIAVGTPLRYLMPEWNKLEQWLLQLKNNFPAGINTINTLNKTPFDLAMERGNNRMVDFLLRNGVVVDLNKSFYKKIFFSAIAHLDVFQIKIFKSYKYDFNIVDDEGLNAFHHLIVNQKFVVQHIVNCRMLDFLMGENVSLACQDKKQLSVFDKMSTAPNKWAPVINYLIEKYYDNLLAIIPEQLMFGLSTQPEAYIANRYGSSVFYFILVHSPVEQVEKLLYEKKIVTEIWLNIFPLCYTRLAPSFKLAQIVFNKIPLKERQLALTRAAKAILRLKLKKEYIIYKNPGVDISQFEVVNKERDRIENFVIENLEGSHFNVYVKPNRSAQYQPTLLQTYVHLAEEEKVRKIAVKQNVNLNSPIKKALKENIFRIAIFGFPFDYAGYEVVGTQMRRITQEGLNIVKFLLSQDLYLTQVFNLEGESFVSNQIMEEFFIYPEFCENIDMIKTLVEGMLIRLLVCEEKNIPLSLHELKKFINVFVNKPYPHGLTVSQNDLEFFKDPIASLWLTSLQDNEKAHQRWQSLGDLRKNFLNAQLLNLYKCLSQLSNALPRNDNSSMFAKSANRPMWQIPSSEKEYIAQLLNA